MVQVFSINKCRGQFRTERSSVFKRHVSFLSLK